MTKVTSAAGFGLPANDPIPAAPATETEVRIICERQVAAKICGMLPADEASAQRILAHASVLFSQFLSLDAVRAAAVEG